MLSTGAEMNEISIAFPSAVIVRRGRSINSVSGVVDISSMNLGGYRIGIASAKRPRPHSVDDDRSPEVEPNKK